MTNNNNPCECQAMDGKTRPRYYVREFIGRIRRLMFLYVWCRHLYRPTMRLLHRFDLHYAPPYVVREPTGKLGIMDRGKRYHWCQWCGLRGESWQYDHNDLSLLHPDRSAITTHDLKTLRNTLTLKSHDELWEYGKTHRGTDGETIARRNRNDGSIQIEDGDGWLNCWHVDGYFTPD